MSAEVIMFRCAICRSLWDTKEKANECENKCEHLREKIDFTYGDLKNYGVKDLSHLMRILEDRYNRLNISDY